MERRDCQAQAAEDGTSPVLYEAHASFGFAPVFHIDLGAAEESGSWRLGDLRRKPLRMRLLLPELWLGAWGVVAIVQLLLSYRHSSIPKPILAGAGFLPFGIVFLHFGWCRLASGLVLLRLRRRGVLEDLHLAGERPVVVFATVRHHLSTRMGFWALLVVAPQLVDGIVDPASRTTILAMLSILALLAWAINGFHRRWSTPNRSASFSALDGWVFLCATDELAPALWNYLRAASVQLFVGIAYVAGTFLPPLGGAVCCVAFAVWVAGWGLRRRLDRLDVARFEKLYTAWLQGEDAHALLREPTQHG